MKVFCTPATRNSVYLSLLFEGLEGRYKRICQEDGELCVAVEHLAAGIPVLLHVHWEEFFFATAKTGDEARTLLERTKDDLARFAERGGKIVLTIHNALPHGMPHVDCFLEIRRTIAAMADVVLVHDDAARAVLVEQTGIDPTKVERLPHPSYSGLFEPAGAADAVLSAPDWTPERLIVGFGSPRTQKALVPLLDSLPADFTRAQGARIQIAGSGSASLKGRHGGRKDIVWNLHDLSKAEVTTLFRRAGCIVLPPEGFYTPGLALLALTLGAVVVAPDVPQYRALLPAAAHRFLYQLNDASDLRRAVADTLTLSRDESRAMRQAGFSVAEAVHPDRISHRLGQIYDRLAQEMGTPVADIDEAMAAMDTRGLPAPALAEEPVIGAWPAQGEVNRNWGDKLNPVVIALMSGRPVLNFYNLRGEGWLPAHLVIGSGLRSAKRQTIVWGSGFIASRGSPPTPKAICAVRGPLSRDELLSDGIDCPEVYGDPALLMPLFYRPAIEPTYDLGIIQHFREIGVEPLPQVPDGMRVLVIDILGSITGVLDAILSCRQIVSSSLHGLIAAHAYGIPATWIKFSDRPMGDDFKFRDYWASVGWRDARAIWVDADTSCADLVGDKTSVTPLVRIDDLIDACPFADPERKAALRRRAAEHFPAVPVVSFLAAALPDPLWTRVPYPATLPPGNVPILSIVIGIRDRGLDRLALALRSIRESEAGDRFEVILSDFGSQDRGAVAALGEGFGCQTLYTPASEWSKSQAINAAAFLATAPYLVAGDADILFAPRTLVTLRANLDALPYAIHALPCADLREQLSVAEIAADQVLPWGHFDSVATMRPRWSAGLIACSTAVFDTMRGYDERIRGTENKDFLKRGREHGHPVNWIEHPNVRVYHLSHNAESGVSSGEVQANDVDLLRQPALERNFMPGASLRTRAPLVSVVIATQGDAALLESTIQSTLAQTMEDFEIVVVDDGSADDTQAVIASFSDLRIRPVHLPAPRDLPAARNIGTLEAHGKYIAVLDDGDLMLPDRLERQITCLRAGDAGSYGGLVDVSAREDGAETICHPGRSPFGVAEMLFAPNLQSHATLLLHRDLCLRYPYEETFAGGGQDHLTSLLAMAGYSLRHCDRYITLRRQKTLGGVDNKTWPFGMDVTRTSILGFLTAAQVKAMQEIGQAAPLHPVTHPELTDQIVDLLGEDYAIGTDRLAYSQALADRLRQAGLGYGVSAGQTATGLAPRDILLDRRDRARYAPLVPAEDLQSGVWRLRRRFMASSFDTTLTQRHFPDNRLKAPNRLPSAVERIFAQDATGRAIGFRFDAADWRGFAGLNLPLDTHETPLFWFEPNGDWQVLMDLDSETEIGVRAMVARRSAPSLSLYTLRGEEALP